MQDASIYEEYKKRYQKIGKVWSPVVKDILQKPDFSEMSRVEDVEKILYRHRKKKILISRANFWKFQKKYGVGKVTVIIRQFEGGSKHFLSIY